jgi:hypothetical protein
MIWQGKDLKYSEIVSTAIALKGSEQKRFVEEYLNSSPHALENIRYIAGYYDAYTAHKIYKLFVNRTGVK